MDKKYYVYKHTLPKEVSKKKNDMIYIGITSQIPKRRWSNGLGYSYNSFFYRAIQKYGWDNFKHEILFNELSLDEANKKEIELINFYNSCDRNHGYNFQTGGSSGYQYSDDVIEHLKQSHSGKNNGMYGKNHSVNTKKQMSEKRKKFINNNGHPNKNKRMSSETKQKISDSQKERLKNKSIKRINFKRIICINTGVIYDSVNHLSLLSGIKVSTLYAHLSKKTARCNNGMTYRYLDEIRQEVN